MLRAVEGDALRLCGRLELWIAGERVDARLRGGQVVTLLAVLALAQPHAVRRDELIDVLWPEELPSDAGAYLSTLLSRLRRVVPLAGRAEVGLQSHLQVDVEEARVALASGRSALTSGRWDEAAARGGYAATVLAGGFLPGVAGTWVERRREETRALEADALEVVVEGRARGGGDAEQPARALIGLAPFRESGHRALMEALARRGNVAEALRVYDELRVLLRDELGVDPSPGLRELHSRLVRGEGPGVVERSLPAGLRISGPFTGRATELVTLELAATGDGRKLVLIAGEPGIGKTRLAAEFAASAHADGALVLYGHCDEDAPIPFQPFVEALRSWAAEVPAHELSARLPADVGELALLLPELRRLASVDELAADPETRRYRLFEAIHELLGALSADAPVVLVLDEMQWADGSSIVLLRHLLRRGSGRVLVLALYRPGESGRALAELRHVPGAVEVALGGLDVSAVAELVAAPRADPAPARDPAAPHAAAAPAPARDPAALAAALHRDTGGNPLFVIELLRHLAETGADLSAPLELPGRVRDVIARRLDRLPDEARRALAVAAVAGAEFDLDVVAAAAGVEADALAETLEAAVAADLVRELSGGRYAFVHALIRATVDEGLSATRRERLHRRIADALPGARVLERAQHRYAAGDGGAELIAAADEAARAAAGALGFEEAVRHYERAVAAAAADPGFDPGARCDLELALVGALRDAGEGEQAAAVALDAAHAAREAGDARRLARAALGYAGPGWGVTGVSDQGAVALLEEAAAELGVDDELLRARVLSRLAVELYWSPLRDRRRALAREAVELCRAHGDDAALAVALSAEHWCAGDPDTLDERLALIAEAGARARAARDIDLVVECRLWELGDHLELGRIDTIEPTADAVERIARDAHRPRWNAWTALLRTTAALATGRFDAAAAQLAAADRRGWRAGAPGPRDLAPPAPRDVTPRDARDIAPPAPRDVAARDPRDPRGLGALADEPEWLARRTLLALARGGLEAVEPVVERTADRLPGLPFWRALHAWVLLRLGRAADAQAAFDRFARRDFADLPRDMYFVVACAIAAEVSDPPRAGALYALLLPYRDRHVVAPVDFTLGSVERSLGLLAAATGELDRADEHLTRAVAANQRLRPWLAETELAHARVLQVRRQPGDEARARALARRGKSAARTLGMTALLSGARPHS